MIGIAGVKYCKFIPWGINRREMIKRHLFKTDSDWLIILITSAYSYNKSMGYQFDIYESNIESTKEALSALLVEELKKEKVVVIKLI